MRKKTPEEQRSHKVQVPLNKAERATLDALRGDVPAAIYFRSLMQAQARRRGLTR